MTDTPMVERVAPTNGEIPEDVMKAAEDALDNLLCNCKDSLGSYAAVRAESIKDIARAIFAERMAERERCARIIDEGFDRPVGLSFRRDGAPSKNDKCPHDRYMYEDCEGCCAAAIRGTKT